MINKIILIILAILIILYSLFSILSGMCLFGVMYLIMIFGNFLFKKDSWGGGDIKLMFVFGLVINPLLGLFVIFLASFLALPISLLILWKRKVNLVPFGPFRVISFMFIYFTRINLDMILTFIRGF